MERVITEVILLPVVEYYSIIRRDVAFATGQITKLHDS